MAALSQSASAGSPHDHHGAPTGFVKRWLYSTNHKDIGTMYIIFAIVAAFIGGAMSIYENGVDEPRCAVHGRWSYVERFHNCTWFDYGFLCCYARFNRRFW